MSSLQNDELMAQAPMADHALDKVEARFDFMPGPYKVCPPQGCASADMYQMFELQGLIQRVIDRNPPWAASTVERCQRLSQRALDKTIPPVWCRVAARQQPDADVAPSADANLLPPFTPADRRQITQFARLYGIEVVAVDAAGEAYA